MLNFWIRVKEKLEYQNLTQKELAEKIDESYNTLQSWMNKDRLPDAEQAVKIAKSLHTSVEFLVTGINVKSKSDYSKTIRLLEEVISELNNNL